MSLLRLKDNEIRESVFDGDREIMSVNLRFPSFEGENAKVCEKLNKYYAETAAEYMNYCKNKHSPRLLRSAAKGANVQKNGAVMNWYVSFLNENILSLLTDVSMFDGKMRNTARFVNNWSLSDCTPLRAKNTFSVTRAAKNLYLDEICSKIKNGEGGFGYHKNAEHLARAHFDFEKYYFTAKGIAFYYDKNILFSGSESRPAFIIPFSEVEGLIPQYRNGHG